MMRSTVVKGLGALALWLGMASPAPAAERPNVIVILVDDLGWMDLGCQGSQYYETPHIDRLAREGMRFTDGYAAAAVCSPTRAAVLTGRYPARIGITDWIRFRDIWGSKPPANPTQYVGSPNDKLLCPPNPYWLELEEITLAELLKQAGYATCHVGKWHLGPEGYWPSDQGFEENHGGCDLGQPPTYFDPYQRGQAGPFQHIPTLQPRREGEYLTDREADEAADFVRRHRDRPFFLHLAHYAVHTPIEAKKELIEKYRAKPKTNQRNAAYAAMVESVDAAAGKILATLDELELADNTLILFTSGNGGLDRDGDPTDNAPLRSGKGYPYEGGIRAPWIIRWPGKVPPATVSSAPIISCDILPTVLEAAGLPLPEAPALDGVSLLDHLRSGGDSKLDRDTLFWHFPHYRHRGHSPYSIIRRGDWKLIKFWEGRYELYNLAEDLSEQNDLAAQMPEKVQQLDSQLMAHLDSVGAKLPRPNPAYRAAARE